MSKLVIVESPTKAKTISKFLGREFKVLSSFGHIRDLPKSDLGVDVEHGYEPKYVIPTTSRKHVKALKDAAEDAEEVLFATDEDREGEAISWHLAEVLKIKPEKVKRIVFHEITKSAIEHAIEHPRPLDQNLVDAQQARRILDRLYGYEISPILWRKVAPKLSAGRVQSVATRLIVERERERMQFKKGGYADILGRFKKGDDTLEAKLVEVERRRVAIGKDFDPLTGALSDEAKKKSIRLLSTEEAETYARAWKDDPWKVLSVEEKPTTSKPSAPFTTSTLQQESARKLNLSSQETMRTAQALYERGYITYMRTDSTFLSKEALSASRKAIEEEFGSTYLPETPNEYTTKVKNAQEAHESIRPSGETFKDPKTIASDLNAIESKLYELIWKRTLASQMLPAKLQNTHVKIGNGKGVFSASGKVVEFAGYMAVYMEDSDEEESGEDRVLPPLQEGDTLSVETLKAETHETKPPARYTEPSLIKVLEANGIGRPSTFASIIHTILAREYVRKDSKALVPTWKAFAVTQLLEQNFLHLVSTDFTAEMEDGLDTIAIGEMEMVPFLDRFFLGHEAYAGLKTLLGQDIDAREAATVPIGEHNGLPLNVRVGRYGPFIEYDGKTANVPEDMAPDHLTVKDALTMIEEQSKGPTPLGKDPATGKHVYVLTGRYGHYVQLGDRDPEDQPTKATSGPAGKSGKAGKNKPKMKSLLPGMEPETTTLAQALDLLSLPKELGIYEKTGEMITKDLGRFGPYIKSGSDSRSIPKDKQLLDFTYEEAVELLNTEKRGHGRGTKTVLKDLGNDPATDQTIQILDGKYGPYASDGKTNASLPKGADPSVCTLEEALALISARKE